MSEIADALGVVRSTAHRLLAMRVFRGFAEQGEDRRYRSGPVISRACLANLGVTRLRAASIPRLRALADDAGDTAHLMALVGCDVEFLAYRPRARPLRCPRSPHRSRFVRG